MSAKRKAKPPKVNRVRFSATIDAGVRDDLYALALEMGVPFSHLIDEAGRMLLRKARRDGPIPKRPPGVELPKGRGDRKGRKKPSA